MTDRDDYQEGGKSEKGEKPQSADALFGKLKGWVKLDYDSRAQSNWRREAREDFAFEAGDQLNEDDKEILKGMNRPVVIFNRIGPIVDSVAGQEVGNRQEVQYVPRTQGVVKVNELMTSAAKWFRQECDAEDEESDAFRDMVVCGMGWTETRLDYDDNQAGDPKIERIDPLEMVWDSSAKKRNLSDKRRVAHIRRDVPLDEARALCPGDHFEDADYNASWVDDIEPEDGNPHENDGRFYDKAANTGGEDADEKTVTLVRIQWWEYAPAWLTLDPAYDAANEPDPLKPAGPQIVTLGKEEFEELARRYKIAGAPMPKFVKTKRKVYRQAYLGAVLLEIGDAPCKDHFSFQSMTGKRDRNKNTFYGLVRAMKDPARWSNKWLSQTMHIMNTTAKGGIAAERGGFFDNDADGEQSWAKQDQVTYLKAGALSGQNPKFIAKPVGQFPQSSFDLMQYAVSSHRDVSGVNVEILGMQQSAGQAAQLDLQRKQSALTILQPLFDGLRRYRKTQGRLLLYLIENYLSDGRLIKIVGKDEAQYVPLVKQEAQSGDTSYDVIVDENPTSANQKEATWAYLQQILPVIGKMLPPATWLALLKYSPLPTSAQKDISDSISQAQQQPDPEQQKRDAELKLEQDKAQARMAGEKQISDAKIAGMQAESAAKIAIDRDHAHSQIMLKAITAPPATDAEGNPVQGSGGGEAAAAIMGLMQQMRQEQADLKQTLMMLAQAQAAPKRLIKDQAGEIVGIAPMGAG